MQEQSTRLDAFWKFVYARQQMFEARRKGAWPPWTDDPVLAAHRFTNVYRASDRVSQFLIRHVLYQGDQRPEEVIFRSLLFRIFNQPDTFGVWWRNFGRQPSLADWDPVRFARLLDNAVELGAQIWNNAYMITPPKDTYGGGKGAKHYGWLRVLDQIVHGGIGLIREAPSLREVYNTLCTFPTVGPFFAFQWTIDLNYSEALSRDFDENSFVIAGGGAKRGLRKLGIESIRSEQAIEALTHAQEHYFDLLGIDFPWLGGARRLHLIDVQNCLCEFDKWTRLAHPEWSLGSRWYNEIKQKFDPVASFEHPLINYKWPPKWQLEEVW